MDKKLTEISAQLGAVLAIASPRCTVAVPNPCGKVAESWLIAPAAGYLDVRGRCEEHPAEDWLPIARNYDPQSLILAVGAVRK